MALRIPPGRQKDLTALLKGSRIDSDIAQTQSRKDLVPRIFRMLKQTACLQNLSVASMRAGDFCWGGLKQSAHFLIHQKTFRSSWNRTRLFLRKPSRSHNFWNFSVDRPSFTSMRFHIHLQTWGDLSSHRYSFPFLTPFRGPGKYFKCIIKKNITKHQFQYNLNDFPYGAILVVLWVLKGWLVAATKPRPQTLMSTDFIQVVVADMKLMRYWDMLWHISICHDMLRRGMSFYDTSYNRSWHIMMCRSRSWHAMTRHKMS